MDKVGFRYKQLQSRKIALTDHGRRPSLKDTVF